MGENSELLRLADNVKRQIEEILFSVVPVINEFVRGGLIPDGIVDPKIRKLLEDICSSSDEKKVLEAWNGLNDRFRQLFTPEAI
ncbi:MAG: hypothetical protein U1C97_00035 [Candidatus Gracilibacteria bacterium]|nr:hypothetical protein [Candidatus Gracilibacteria bacterium]